MAAARVVTACRRATRTTVIAKPDRGPARTSPNAGRYRLATAAAAVLFAGAVVLVGHGALSPSPGDRFVDTQVYRLGAHAMLHRHDPYLPVAAHGGVFTYPPLSAYLFTVLLPFGVTGAGTVLLILILTVLTAAAVSYLCLSRAGKPLHARRALIPATLALTAVCLPLEPITNNVSFGQIGVLLAGLATADLLTTTRLPRGFLTGVAAAVKLTPALFLIYLWVSGQRRAAVTGAATAGGLTVAAAAVFPAASRAYWGAALWQTSRVGASDGPRNRSLWGLAQRLIPGHSAALAVTVLVGGLLTVWGLIRARRCHVHGDEVTAVAIVGCLSCLVSPITWTHHLVWLVLALVLLVTRRGRPLLLAPLLLWALLPYPALFAETMATQPNVQVVALIAVVLVVPGRQLPAERTAAVPLATPPVTPGTGGPRRWVAGLLAASGEARGDQR